MHELLKDRQFYICIGIIASSVYLWKKAYETYKTTNRNLKNLQLFQARHNCVIMYSRKYLRGWPPHIDGIPINADNVKLLLEPFLYFINTAQETLDIAIMTMKIPIIFDALLLAKQRGVDVRIIFNFESIGPNVAQNQKLKRAGIHICYYISKNEVLDSIMHYKYMIKDNGFVCMGSLNLANISSFINNYEDVIFSSNHNVVSQFHSNFENCWKMIESDNRKLYNKSILREAHLL